jgi:hypothetical protein
MATPAFITMVTTSSTTTTEPAGERATFTLVLRPEPGVDPVHALRSALKRLLRQYGLRCISAEENYK